MERAARPARYHRVLRRYLVLVLVACSGTPPVTVPVVAPVRVVTPAKQPIIVIATGAASRGSASPRRLWRIVAARRGVVELATGSTEVSLSIARVVSGTLADPDHAKRPIGTNHLPVILVDEAAHAAPTSLDGFEGTWKLTPLADGTLVASAIEDTPFDPERVRDRRTLIARTRADLRSPLPQRRLRGLVTLGKHRFLELVPDVIALLADHRAAEDRVVVNDVAEARLRELVAPLGHPAMPATGDADAWDAFWRTVTTAAPGPPTVVASREQVIATLQMNQSWPLLRAVPDGRLVVGVTRLARALDGRQDGVFVTAGGTRTWITKHAVDGLDAALGPAGLGIVYATVDDRWSFTLVPASGAPRTHALPRLRTHVALAASDHGFALASLEGTSELIVDALDTFGKLRHTRRIRLSGMPVASYHRGVRPVSITSVAGGWLATVEIDAHVLALELDYAARVKRLIELGPTRGIAQPTANGSAAAWVELDVLVTAKFDGAATRTGSEIGAHSAVVALPDGGFAVAWIEAASEVHVGRWDHTGQRIADDVIDTRPVAPFAITLARDGDALAVTYQVTARYPYAIVRRVLK